MTDEEEKPRLFTRNDQEFQADMQDALYCQNKYFSNQIDVFYFKSRDSLDKLYKEYLNKEIDLEAAQKKFQLVEYEYEKLINEIEYASEEGLLITHCAMIEIILKDFVFYRNKLQLDMKRKDSKTTAAPLDKEVEEIKPEIPCVIQDLIQNSSLVETKPDTIGRFKPNHGVNDIAITQWIYDYSGYKNELTADVYAQYIYTTVKLSTIEKYMSDARRKSESE
ncbi:hypothetical protein TREPR_2259 [Treponema primitia ZAS-2]|uniref:Uncharacterized protein n=1 Tax=Treponema primitia (strain ATCC BAA-887 / DSM 12427 / ZAS-2) TaxID=545694 RepID=F5YIE7_TREPZ|nr:hypothetical protein [Treponema primitia]AEF85678.1 hypothetical protein TREPR_2259 [Treponema primitia ZAS-2]